MPPTDRELMQQPLRTHWEGCEEVHPECKQPEQEPVAHTLNCVCGAVWDISLNGAEEMVHTPDATKPRREWVGLTDDQVSAIADQHPVEGFELDIMAFARSIEAKLKEKNT